MTKNEPKNLKLRLPLTIDIEKVKTVEKKVFEIDPNRIKPGEIVIIKVSQWGGLKNECFVVMNVDGKHMLIRQLKRKGKKEKPNQ